MKRLLDILSFALFFTSIQLYEKTMFPVCEFSAMPARGEHILE
ncbi:hypothetical protein [Bacteroidetes bacterium endosymbiont of Geopemphigus sp.]|nr:hypothetical protein [Bacteroidetes bacterium endosymbiont of Geopemphigus sp.]